MILEELLAEKEAIENRFLEIKSSLEEEIGDKIAKIERLEQRIRQLQG
jgi:Na+/phosphate symporter